MADKLIERLETIALAWLDKFEKEPLSTGLKVVFIVWVIGWLAATLIGRVVNALPAFLLGAFGSTFGTN